MLPRFGAHDQGSRRGPLGQEARLMGVDDKAKNKA